ncbi:MAG: hypothetical protein IPK99_13610 [Flavobacteriales bacterium]|nr:hypothetical protein [Flavobacteriales bacterium]
MKALIHTPTNDLQQSIDFYTRSGFTRVSENPVLFSDGKAVIEIDPVRHARAGVRCYMNDHSNLFAKLGGAVKPIPITGGHVLSDPSGVWVYVMDGEAPQLNIATASASLFGNFAGLSLESTDVARSVAFWSAFGLETQAGGAGQGWVSLGMEGWPPVSIMAPLNCPHLFFNPSLTYFNGKEGNPKVIANVRKAGIPITEEITHFNKEGLVDNIIVRDPGGLGFFLFND